MSEPVRFFRVRMASGEIHVGRDPKRPGGPWIPKKDAELMEWMGEQGHSLIEEIPLERDYTAGNCARCGCPGVEIHHTAPAEVFDDSDEWPTIELCVGHHREWHRRMNAWARELTERGGE